MKLNQCYVKVSALYFTSTVTANVVVKNNNSTRALIQILAGYTVFAADLKYLTKRKNEWHLYKNSYDFTLSWLFFNWEWDRNNIFAEFISSSHHNMHWCMLTEFHKKGVHEMTVDIGRIYDNKNDTDAIRILVDKVWPGGISRRAANLDYWLENIAPSTELRQWFQHGPKPYGAFKEKYEGELRDNETQKEAFEELETIVNQYHHVLLLYSAKDAKHNQAVVLQQLLST